MKYVKQFLAIACFFLLSCGCQEVPEGVKENMEQYGDNPQLEASELEYCSIEELRKAKIPDIKTSSLSMPFQVDFSEVEDVSLLDLSCYDDFQKESNVEKYALLFGVDKDGFAERQDPAWGKESYYEDEKGQEYISLSQNGGMVHIGGLAFECVGSTVEASYNLARDDISGISVKLRDGAASLSGICSSTEEWLEENLHMDGIRQQVTDVIIRKLDQESGDVQRISMCAEYDYKGIHFNNHTLGRTEEEGIQSKEVTTYLFTQLAMDASGSPSFLSRNEGFQIDGVKPLEKVVSFESAVRMLGEKLSGFGHFDITEVLPLYDIYPDFKAGVVGRKMEARPVYAFLVETKEEGEGKIGIIKPNRCRYFFFVDMETGELTTNLKMGRGG